MNAELYFGFLIYLLITTFAVIIIGFNFICSNILINYFNLPLIITPCLISHLFHNNLNYISHLWFPKQFFVVKSAFWKSMVIYDQFFKEANVESSFCVLFYFYQQPYAVGGIIICMLHIIKISTDRLRIWLRTR